MLRQLTRTCAPLRQEGYDAQYIASEAGNERMEDMLSSFGEGSEKEVDEDNSSSDDREILGIDPDEDGGLFDSDDE